MYKQLNDAEYSKLRKDLLQKNNSGHRYRMEFVSKLRDSEEFCRWIRSQVSSVHGELIPLWEHKLTEHEYKDPPTDTERKLYEAWRSFIPKYTCKPTFWGEVTLCHIETGSIESSYLAANGGSQPGGTNRISKLLKTKDENGLDSCVRTAIRRLSGLPERGNRSVYVNCPFSRSWWRTHLCEEVSETTDLEHEAILKVFSVSQDFWENIVSMVVSRNSVLGDRNARDALILALVKTLQNDKNNQVFKGQGLKNLCRILGIRAAWQEFGVLSVSEINDIIEFEISRR